jgi:hypothetical protein
MQKDNPSSASEKKALHIGCGYHKIPGAIGLDITPLPSVDVVRSDTLHHWPTPYRFWTSVSPVVGRVPSQSPTKHL